MVIGQHILLQNPWLFLFQIPKLTVCFMITMNLVVSPVGTTYIGMLMRGCFFREQAFRITGDAVYRLFSGSVFNSSMCGACLTSNRSL